MDIFGEVVNLISNVGFPIAISLILLYNNKQTQKEHKEETVNLTKAIENNTLVLQKVVDKLDA